MTDIVSGKVSKSAITDALIQAEKYEDEAKLICRKIDTAEVFNVGFIFKKKVNVWAYLNTLEGGYAPRRLFRRTAYAMALSEGIVTHHEHLILEMIELLEYVDEELSGLLSLDIVQEEITISNKVANLINKMSDRLELIETSRN